MSLKKLEEIVDETNGSTQTEASDASSKKNLNLILALLLTSLGAWMTVADFSHHGDLIFQSSSSILLTAFFVSGLFFVGVVIAAIPKRFLVGLNLLIISRVAMGFPLNIWMDNTVASRIVTVAFLSLSLVYVILALRRIEIFTLRPWMRLKHTCIMLFLCVFIGVLSIPVFITGYVYGAQNLLGRYTSITPRGVNLLEAVFEKDGQKVHLVGMMHIGDSAYYGDLIKRLNATPESNRRRLVLTEGVKDRNNILPEAFAKGETYARWAQFLGVESQKSLISDTVEVENQVGEKLPVKQNSMITWQDADIDVSDFQKHHRDLLIKILESMNVDNIAEILSADAAKISGMEIEDLMVNALIIARNDILMKRFNELEVDFEEIYIPWGAAHLPDIEDRLVALGYKKIDETVRPVLKFWK